MDVNINEDDEGSEQNALLLDAHISSTNCWSKMEVGLRDKVNTDEFSDVGPVLIEPKTSLLTCRDFENWEEVVLGWNFYYYYYYY